MRNPAREDRGEGISLKGVIAVLMILVVIVSSGCINKVMQKSPEPGSTPDTSPAVTAENATALPNTTSVPDVQVPIVEMTPARSNGVVEVTPILTPDPYPVLHATQINSTPLVGRLNRATIFEKSYHLTGGAEGLLVNVAEGPLYIVYVVTPQNDCLKNPGSCLGDMTKPVQRPYLTITVRDNQTHEILVQDGYAREYSSDTGNYEFSFTSKSTADTLLSSASYTDVTTTSSPGPRFIPIYKEGTFHITIEGAFVDAEMKILAGPTLEAVTITNQASTPAAGQESEEWG